MEKKRTHLYILSKSIGLLLFVISFNPSFGQKLRPIKGHCGMYYASMADLYQQKQKELDFYDFQPGQIIASIGAGCCNWESIFAATTDSLTIYLEDIDSTYFKRSQANFV